MVDLVSLFTGAGGFDIGFKWSGYDIQWANDNFADASITYKKNISKDVEYNTQSIDTIDDIESIPDSDIIIGGPPCQSFSHLGKRRPGDPNTNLVWNYLEIVATKQPEIFLMENVPGIRSAKYKKNNDIYEVFPSLLKKFGEAGYTVNSALLNAADYGVPQKRNRIFIVGRKHGMKIPPPPPTHFFPGEKTKTNPNQTKLFKDKRPWVTSREALDDLTSPRRDTDIGHYIKEPHCWFKQFVRESKIDSYKNHQMPYMSDKDLAIIKCVKPGGNYMDVPDHIATNRIKKFKKTGGRTTTYGRLDPAKPSFTINTHFSRPNVGCNIHYKEDRLITIREGLRLQSFPDWFTVYSKSKRGLYKQVGNAVPPLLGLAWAKHLKKILK